MQTPHYRQRHKPAAGFTLPAILVVVGALLILAVGILLVTGIERSTARSFVDRQRAELAARAGLEEIRAILNTEAANDEFLVIQSNLKEQVSTSANSGKPPEKAPFLFLTRAKKGSTPLEYTHLPMFSSAASRNGSNKSSTLAGPAVEDFIATSKEGRIDFQTLPYQDKVRTDWLPVKDERDRTVGRYAFWIEDLQSRIDPKLAGNQKGDNGEHVRAEFPFPAPGLNPDPASDKEPVLDQIPLYALDPDAEEEDQGTLGKTLFKNRPLLISPDSVLAAAGVVAPITRDKDTGRQIDPVARAVEENLAAGVQPYKEKPLVPYSDGIHPSLHGEPKLNLNKLLSTGGDAAVSEMADFIKKGLPNFDADRKGGFPDDYNKTLAANAIDYADEDDAPTMSASYRGLDAYPLVSEFLMRFRWENVQTIAGRKYVILSASTYVELWNMTNDPSNKPVSGTAQVSFETGYFFPLGANPNVSLADMSNATPVLEEKNGYRWFPSFEVNLKPNEYRVYHVGTVTYRIDAGSAAVFVSSPLVLEGETFGNSGAGYRLNWNGQMVDQTRGGVHRNNSSLNFPTDTASQPRQRTRTTIPSHTHTQNGNFRNNMGDPRMSYYNQAPQEANIYPGNYSPNRRNIRWTTIYGGDAATKPKIFGRVMPSEWPDGGHNSTYDNNSFVTTDERINPDDPRFFPSNNSPLRNPVPEEAPFRLSNRGRFYSATELGRVYDPIMWEVDMPPSFSNSTALPNQPWGNVIAGSRSVVDLGGGNTLRIGRPEHPRFDQPNQPGREAYRLLDLFHAGQSMSEAADEREGPVTQIEGHVNINTAKRETIRTLVMGARVMDPKISRRTSESHNTTNLMAPPVAPFKPTPDQISKEADLIADAIIETRSLAQFSSPSGIAEARDKATNSLVFGNRDFLPDGKKMHLTDSAAEELFARVYESSTVRSRNFRIWVVGQALTPTTSTTTEPEVLAEVRRAFTVFADPGERNADGSIDPTKTQLRILHENDF